MTGLSLALLVAATVVVVLLTRGDDSSVGPAPVAPQARQDLAASALMDLSGAIATERDGGEAALPDGGGPGAREFLTTALDNARKLRVADFDVRYVDEDRAISSTLPEGQWAAAVDTSWRFAGFDRDAAHAELTFTFGLEGDRAVVLSVGGGDRRAPLWLTTPLQVQRGPGTLVMVAADREQAAYFTKVAKRAVQVVRRVVPRWRQELVVEVPNSADGLDRMLGAQPGEYANIAAVTATVDGSLSPTAPVHVFVNPGVFLGLERRGAQVVMSHEVAHVALDAATSTTPLWLLEGFADYVALRDVDIPLSVSAAQIVQQVRQDGPPDQLPGPQEFDTQTAHLGAAYEAAWLACRLLARLGGEEKLLEFYRRVSDGEPVGETLVDVFGFDEKELVQRWQAELTGLAD